MWPRSLVINSIFRAAHTIKGSSGLFSLDHVVAFTHVVDTLLGEFQTVIKPLHEVFSQVKCISGSTILGSGEVALILDVPQLIHEALAGAAAASRLQRTAPHAETEKV